MIKLEELTSFIGYLALATLIFGIISYKNYSRTNAKYFIFSILFAVITEFVSLYYESFGEVYANIFGNSNYPIGNTFTIVQISFFLLWIRQILNSSSRKKMILVFTIMYWIFAIFNTIYGQSFMTELQKYTYAIGVIFLLIAISFYFIESFNKETIFSATDSIEFWFILGILLFFGTLMPFMFAFELFLSGNQNVFDIILFSLNAIMYGCFCVGFYKSYKENNVID